MDSGDWSRSTPTDFQSLDLIDVTGEEPVEAAAGDSTNASIISAGNSFSFDDASPLYGRVHADAHNSATCSSSQRYSVGDHSPDALGARRHSQRSVKRRRFDDELVESSLVRHERVGGALRHRLLHMGSGDGATGGGELSVVTLTSPVISDSHAASSVSALHLAPPPPLPVPARQRSHSRDADSLEASAPATVAVTTAPPRRKPHVRGSLPNRGRVSRRKPLLKREHSPTVATAVEGTAVAFETVARDPERWKAQDDFLLIQAVQQTSDLAVVHTCVKFSCAFSLRDIQERWYALLYDKTVSKRARSTIRQLPPDVLARLRRRAPFSAEEETALGTVASNGAVTAETFEGLLRDHETTFHAARTARCLCRHWQLMKHHRLLPDQIAARPVALLQPLPAAAANVPLHGGDAAAAASAAAQPQAKSSREQQQFSFSDAEDEALKKAEHGGGNCGGEAVAAGGPATVDQDQRLAEAAVKYELALADRRQKREIRRLEAELPLWQALIAGVVEEASNKDFDSQTLAVLRGQLVRYLMRSKKVTFGRATPDHLVDIDLSLEGPSYKVSRQQGSIQLQPDGEFVIENQGQRPLYVDGRPVTTGMQHRLTNNSVLEVCSMRFVFFTNQKLVRSLKSDSCKSADPLLSHDTSAGGVGNTSGSS